MTALGLLHRSRLPWISILALFVGSGAWAVCWEFDEVDPHHVYSTDDPHVLPNGFVGQRAGDHGGATLPYSEVAGGVLVMRGGTGDFSDRLGMNAPIGSPSSNWRVTVTYLHQEACPERPVFDLLEDVGFRATVHSDLASLNGLDAPWTSVADTWYTLEVDNNPQGGFAELRIWPAGDPKPALPLVTAIPTGEPTNLEVRGNNLCAPEISVESLCFETEVPVDLTQETWGAIKATYR